MKNKSMFDYYNEDEEDRLKESLTELRSDYEILLAQAQKLAESIERAIYWIDEDKKMELWRKEHGGKGDLYEALKQWREYLEGEK